MAGYGIGGGGFAGLAVEQLAPPVQAALATSASGGTITAGTYRYAVTAINANGETLISNEQTIVTTGSTSTVTVTWAPVTGATGYKLYKTAAGGGTGTELLYKTVGVVVSDIDTAPGAPSGAIPTANTAANPGVYAAPTFFFPFLSETLSHKQDTQWRRPIRSNVDNLGGVPGNVNTEGDIELEGLVEPCIYFHKAARSTLVKSGPVSSLYTYAFTPNAAATAQNTLSVTIVRDGEVFGYTGCVTGSFKYTIDNGQLKATFSMRGSDEASQSMPIPTYSGQAQVFGAGDYNIQIPTATQVFDMDTFEWTVEDNAEPQFRLRSGGQRGAQFMKFGERNVSLSTERDFTSRTDYDAYKALTAQAITLQCDKTTGEQVKIDMPVAVKESYELGLSGQGDLIRGRISYQGVYDNATSKAYGLAFKSLVNIV
jgi:hypothetical protein